jgi:hypothetical protein
MTVFIPFIGKQQKDTGKEGGESGSMTGDGGAKPTEEDGAEPKIQQESMAEEQESLQTEQGGAQDGAEASVSAQVHFGNSKELCEKVLQRTCRGRCSWWCQGSSKR